MKIAGLILAGGEGRRMGGADKALLSLGGRPLIRHVVERLSPQVEELAISGRTSHSGFGLPVLADAQIERFGPLAGVAAGLAWAAGIGADRLVTAAVDTPFLPCDLVPRLLLAAEGHDGLAIAITPEGAHPTFALWPVSRLERIGQLLDAGERRMRVAADGAGRALFADDDAFFNINTPEDLARAEAMLAKGG
jgi:molybdopterin-guanine dinucleotide biosynthesis protein A